MTGRRNGRANTVSDPYPTKQLRVLAESESTFDFVEFRPGRPSKVLEVGGTEPRSVRFPKVVWRRLETQAKHKGLTLHAALRQAILEWLKPAA